ncbi:phosphate-starvation-inducible PsiE family protein [Methylacidimicrobium sp. B4]|uniref:phosphate-starvation-inducible PsiE family protein n=1 Tax=Methylacidimicrobium sp. B4 TaxID=2796139 RepID=UPI001A8D6151|nr:phosphate-starvation-inducible PsiE family protein [Methylacidimicrobium sp. B4]QSR85287.1 phosphate-starvation-inducible PsiE family protein [Methylacidimicrobium sp. B4]
MELPETVLPRWEFGRGTVQKALLRFFRIAVAAAFNLIILLLLFGLGIEIVRSVWELAPTLVGAAPAWSFRNLVGRTLSLVVLLELLRAFVEYFQFDRIRLHVLLEAAAAFVLRELMLSLFDEKITGINVLIWSVAVVVLVLGRTVALFSPPLPGAAPKRTLPGTQPEEPEEKRPPAS